MESGGCWFEFWGGGPIGTGPGIPLHDFQPSQSALNWMTASSVLRARFACLVGTIVLSWETSSLDPNDDAVPRHGHSHSGVIERHTYIGYVILLLSSVWILKTSPSPAPPPPRSPRPSSWTETLFRRTPRDSPPQPRANASRIDSPWRTQVAVPRPSSAGSIPGNTVSRAG